MENLLAIVSVLATLALVFGLYRALTPDTSAIDERLRRYGVRRQDIDEARTSEVVGEMMAAHIERAIAGHKQGTLVKESF